MCQTYSKQDKVILYKVYEPLFQRASSKKKDNISNVGSYYKHPKNKKIY